MAEKVTKMEIYNSQITPPPPKKKKWIKIKQINEKKPDIF